jgi:hypothetical protein
MISASRSFCRRAILLILFGLVVVGCSSDDTEKTDQEEVTANPYATWETLDYQNIRFLYPPNHPDEQRIEEIGRNYINAIRQVTKALGMEPIQDTILFIYYSGYKGGREMTGHEYPYATDTAIHFWLPSFPGPVLMQYLLPRWSPRGTQFPFLYHGLIALYDFSGQNYHASTIGYYNKGRFISLDSLARDTSVNSDSERYQSALGASFAAFIISQTGSTGIKALYEQRRPFPEAVKFLFGITVDSLQNAWLNFVKANVPKDSIRDSLWE